MRSPLREAGFTKDAVRAASRAKKVCLPSGKQRIYPEHDDVAALCASSGQLSYQEAYRLVLSAIESGNENG